MKGKNPRTFWLALSALAIIFAALAVNAPRAYAQAATTDTDISPAKQRGTDIYIQILRQAMAALKSEYVDEIDPKALYKASIDAMLKSLDDPYTVYLDESLFRSMQDTTNGQFGGVGLTITKREKGTPENPAYVEVSEPVENGPGQKAGVLRGDLITEIDGKATPDLTMDEVLDLLRGEVGKNVSIKVLRRKTQVLSFDLTREIIEVPTVKFAMIGDVGYLRISEFTPQTPARVQDAVDFFEGEGYGSMIVDVRGNPGGLINSVADVVDKFVDSGVVVSTKGRTRASVSSLRASPSKTSVDKKIPVVVLIDEGSASASEILAGALKDKKRAYLVGAKTYGKGSVQTVRPLPFNDGIKYTIARYYTPSEACIDKTGIPPDLEVKFPKLSEDGQKALQALSDSMKIQQWADSHLSADEGEVAAFAESLAKECPVEERILRRMINLELRRTKGEPVYDLDFDLQLQAAVKVLQEKNFDELMQSVKTVSELQAEMPQNSSEEKEEPKGE